ncbi:MAG: iron-sulfur cluster assembly accessory protein [Chloroflexi bacterium]|nr:iron-sulfur cluster assembly accessory protein [Chloroflexota bacterium]
MRTLDKTEVETTLLSLTPLAAERVRALLAERNLPDHALRVFVAGSGCSGLRYGMALEGAPAETDTSLEFDGVKVVIDPYSAQYLRGATVDYVELVTGAGFKIENPNAPASSCGCGQSASNEGESGCGGGCC